MKIALIVIYCVLALCFNWGYICDEVSRWKAWFMVVWLLLSPILFPCIVLYTLGNVAAYAPTLSQLGTDKAYRDAIMRHLH